MLELHCHTTYSDGTLTPSQLVKAALSVGVRALAITDHDTLAGWDEAFAAAGDQLEIVPGLELSAVHNERSLHILGFYPDRDKLRIPLAERLEGRKRRAQQMIANLTDLGYPIDLPMLSEGMAPSRPHLAAALVQAGYVQSYREAFDRFLGDNAPAFVQYEKFSSFEGIQLLRACGAVPVWAHPCLFRGGRIKAVLTELIAAGLMGIEVYHPTHSPSDIRQLEELCSEHGLLITGGSDYHGPVPDQKLSDCFGLNSLQLPLSLLEPLKQSACSLNSKQS
jgi:3',5'-nucleoside bisphosphate phosphatase